MHLLEGDCLCEEGREGPVGFYGACVQGRRENLQGDPRSACLRGRSRPSG